MELGKRVSGVDIGISKIILEYRNKFAEISNRLEKANHEASKTEKERNAAHECITKLGKILETAHAKRAQALKDLGVAVAECGDALVKIGVKDAQNFQKETPISSFEDATNFISSTGKGVTKLVAEQKKELDKLKEEFDKLRKEQETKDAELKQKDELIENLKAQNEKGNQDLRDAKQSKILTNETRIKQLEEENKKLNTRKNQETIKANNAEINRLRGENSKLRNEIDKLQKKIDEMKKNQVTLVEVKTEIEVISLD